MESKFDPKAKVKQGQLSDSPEGKQPNREHTNIDFSQHTHRKQEPFAYDVDVPSNLVLSMYNSLCLIWLMKKIINNK